ncbi:MAG: hypothetical protein GY765_02995 [bacterium]|nr:hypothetical protein [bacterium]
MFGTGMELTGKVSVKEDKREYRPQLLINEDGHVSRAECTCTFYRKQGVKQGPCEHLIALRLAHAQAEEELKSGKARKTVTMETRTYSKRSRNIENMCRVTLDRKRLKIRWGVSGKEMRAQNLLFNSIDEARAAYFDRVGNLESRGYLDAG